MTKTIRLVQNYLVYSLPLVLICMTWGTIYSEKEILQTSNFTIKFLWEALSWNLMLWFGVLILFLLMLVVVPQVRERTLKRLANLKERDEREQQITVHASRMTYISTMSLIIFLLFFSIFSLKVRKYTEAEAFDGKKGQVTIGLQFNLLDQSRIEVEQSSGKVLIETKDLPFSKTGILLLVLLWQLAAFNWSARREFASTAQE